MLQVKEDGQDKKNDPQENTGFSLKTARQVLICFR